MGLIARQRLAASTFTDATALEALERVLLAAVLQGAAADADVPTERRRKLLADVTLMFSLTFINGLAAAESAWPWPRTGRALTGPARRDVRHHNPSPITQKERMRTLSLE